MAESEVPTLDNQVKSQIKDAMTPAPDPNKIAPDGIPDVVVIPESELVPAPPPPVFADVYEAGTEVVKAAHLRLRNAKAGVAEVSAVQTEAITEMQAAQDELMAAKSNWQSAARQQIALLTESLDRNS